ncbi:MAG TPA: HD domain-containing protein, partial [Spirochaetota bacterium]
MKSLFAREYAFTASQSPVSVFGARFFDQHLSVVAQYAVRLAESLGADRDVVETAAYLHDTFAIFNPDRIPEHAAEGALLIESLLRTKGYDDDFARKVAQCIRTHSS